MLLQSTEEQMLAQERSLRSALKAVHQEASELQQLSSRLGADSQCYEKRGQSLETLARKLSSQEQQHLGYERSLQDAVKCAEEAEQQLRMAREEHAETRK